MDPHRSRCPAAALPGVGWQAGAALTSAQVAVVAGQAVNNCTTYWLFWELCYRYFYTKPRFRVMKRERVCPTCNLRAVLLVPIWNAR